MRLAALAAIAAFAACSGGNTLTGTFTLFGTSGCTVHPRGYDDIRSGLDVTVRDGAGAIIATGRLGSGTLRGGPQRCEYPFTVPNVPSADFYSIEVGRRGALTYSRAELDQVGWHVITSLGR